MKLFIALLPFTPFIGIVLLLLGALLLLLLPKKPRNRRTGLPRPWNDPRDVNRIHHDILNEQRARRL